MGIDVWHGQRIIMKFSSRSRLSVMFSSDTLLHLRVFE